MVQTFLMLLTATNKYKTTDNLFSTENYINGTYAQYFLSLHMFQIIEENFNLRRGQPVFK